MLHQSPPKTKLFGIDFCELFSHCAPTILISVSFQTDLYSAVKSPYLASNDITK